MCDDVDLALLVPPAWDALGEAVDLTKLLLDLAYVSWFVYCLLGVVFAEVRITIDCSGELSVVGD